MRDIVNLLYHAVALAPGAKTNGTLNGNSIDTNQFNKAEFVVIPGTWTDGTHAFKLQDSDDNSTWADVAATDTNKYFGSFTSITSAGTAVVQKVGYIGIRRYVRFVATVSGATTGAVYGVICVLGDYKHFGYAPVQTPTAII